MPEPPPYVSNEIKVEQSTFLINVGEWGLDDQIKAVIDEWFMPLTAVYTSVTGIISGILGWVYEKGKKR